MVDIAIAAISSFRIWDNRDWQYEYWSTGCEELFGYTVQELMADKNLWLSQVVPEERETIVMPLLEAFFAQRNATAEYRFHRKDGSVRWISSTYVCQKIEDNCGTIVAVHQDISERKRTEAALRQSEAEFRAMFNLIGVGMAQADIKTRRFLRANAAFCAITGYSEAELLALTVDDLNHPDDRDLLHGDSYQSEKRYRRKDGSTVWVLATGNILRDAEGQPLLAFVMIQDISDRKHLETERQAAKASLRVSEERYRLLSEISPVGIFRNEVSGACTYINDKTAQLVGVPPEDCLGLNWVNTLHPDDRQWVYEGFQAFVARSTIEPNATNRFECRHLHPNGAIVWVLVQIVPQRDPTGNITGYIGTLTDITDRKQLEIALQSSEEKLRLALDLNAIGIWEWNIGTGVVFWNASHYTVLGYQPGEIEPSYQRWRDRVHPNDIEFAEQQIIQALEAHTDYEAEFRLVMDDGSIRWLHSKGRGLYDEAGQPLRMVGVEYDISDRKQAEAALRHNQEMFSALVENAPFGIYLIDAEFRLQRINQGAEAVFSNIDPLIGRDFAEIIRIIWPEPFATEAIDRFRYTFATGESYYSPVIVEQRANIDEIQSYDWQIHRITLPDSSYGVVCYFYDLSEIKRAEEIIRRTAQRDAFLVTLSDALRPLADPIEIQATATRILGEGISRYKPGVIFRGARL